MDNMVGETVTYALAQKASCKIFPSGMGNAVLIGASMLNTYIQLGDVTDVAFKLDIKFNIENVYCWMKQLCQLDLYCLTGIPLVFGNYNAVGIGWWSATNLWTIDCDSGWLSVDT